MTAAVRHDGAWTVEPDDVGRLRSACHEPGGSRSCMHLLAAPPQLLLFRRNAVGGLNFQPRVCPPPAPCLASRQGDVLTLAFDAYDAAIGASHHLKPPRYRFRYQLHPVRWAGDDEADADQLLGVMLP